MVKPLWISDGRLVLDEDGSFPSCICCTCNVVDCEPKVLAKYITSDEGDPEGTAVWDLTPYQNKKDFGQPCGLWRIRDVGEAHWDDESQPCSGTIYHVGEIDSDGILVDLPDKFETSYSYPGHMILEQGCRMSDGSIMWTCDDGA